MNRRLFLALLGVTPPAIGDVLCTFGESGKQCFAQPKRADVLLVGDSLAFGLGPPLKKLSKARGHEVIVNARGGTTARQWLGEHWFAATLARHRPEVLLVSLGTNCRRPERPVFGDDVAGLLALVPEETRVIWLFPPSSMWFSTQYIRDGLAKNAVEVIEAGALQLNKDRVHPTIRGNLRWARALVSKLW